MERDVLSLRPGGTLQGSSADRTVAHRGHGKVTSLGRIVGGDSVGESPGEEGFE